LFRFRGGPLIASGHVAKIQVVEVLPARVEKGSNGAHSMSRPLVPAAQAATILAALAVASSTQAQVNTDTLRGDLKDDGLDGSIGGKMTGRTGNVESMAAGGSAHIQGLYRKHWGLLYTSADFERYDHETLVEQTFAFANYGYQWFPRVMPEAYVQAQSDKFRLLRFRFVTGAGPRFGLILEPSFSLYAATAYMYEYESRNVPPGGPDERITHAHRSDNTLSIVVRLDPRTRMMFVTYWQPRFDRIRDYHLLQDASLAYTFAGNLEASIVFSWLHDNEPPATLEKNDVEINNVLRWKF
jgi:Protein of unknown function, DUF481